MFALKMHARRLGAASLRGLIWIAGMTPQHYNKKVRAAAATANNTD